PPGWGPTTTTAAPPCDPSPTTPAVAAPATPGRPGPYRDRPDEPREVEALKPAPFEYHAPGTIAEAVGLLAELGDDARPLAGGQSLVPLMALRLSRRAHLVDLNGVAELAAIGSDADGG